MQSLKAALDYFVTTVTKSVGVYTTLIGIFLYHVVFDKDLECTCKDQTSVCWSYMILPVCIIFFMVLRLDGSFQVFLKYCCLKWTCRFCCFLLPCVFRAFFIGMMWPMSVLIDGDWYTCCYNEKKLFCRNQTAEDQMSIKELKNTSGIYGFGALLCIIFVAGCLWPIPWRKCCCRCGSNECCTRPCLKEFCCCCCESESRNKDFLFQRIVLEEGENLVTNKLIEAAKVKINEKLDGYANNRQWERCCDVLVEIIEGPPPDEAPNPSCGPLSAEEGGNGSGEEREPTGQLQSHRSPYGSSPNADESIGQSQSHGSPSVSIPNADEPIGQSQSHGSPSVSSHNYGENEPLLRKSSSESSPNVATSSS